MTLNANRRRANFSFTNFQGSFIRTPVSHFQFAALWVFKPEPFHSTVRPMFMKSGSSDDQDLIIACRSGETSAFGELVRRYQDRLYPTVLRLTGRPEDAQDLLQDTFFRAFQKLDRFHGESSFYT